MKHKTTMTLSEARDYYDMPRQAIANRLRSDGVRPVSAVRNNSHRPASLYRVADIEAAVRNLRAAWALPRAYSGHIEISRQRERCPVCGKYDYGSNVRGGWCLECWCKEYNHRHPVITDLARSRRAAEGLIDHEIHNEEKDVKHAV